MCVFCKIKHSFTLNFSTLHLSLVPHTDPQTHRLDCFLKFSELSGQVGISRIPSKNADRKSPIFLVNNLLLIWFHKHSFNPYPSISGVGISSIPSKNTDRKLPIFLVNALLLFCSQKHSFTPYPSLSPYSAMDRIMDRGRN